MNDLVSWNSSRAQTAMINIQTVGTTVNLKRRHYQIQFQCFNFQHTFCTSSPKTVIATHIRNCLKYISLKHAYTHVDILFYWKWSLKRALPRAVWILIRAATVASLKPPSPCFSLQFPLPIPKNRTYYPPAKGQQSWIYWTLHSTYFELVEIT